MRTLAPAEYLGQDLCPKCGDDGTGTRFWICADTTPSGKQFTHAQSCAKYHYGDLCAACDAELRAEFGD